MSLVHVTTRALMSTQSTAGSRRSYECGVHCKPHELKVSKPRSEPTLLNKYSRKLRR